jgi:hypothetical protein
VVIAYTRKVSWCELVGEVHTHPLLGPITLSMRKLSHQVFEDGQKLSTGLNILLDERLPGKTYTLDKMSETVKNAEYIRQFSLVQQDEDKYEREFNRDVLRKRSTFVDEYLPGLKNVLDGIMNIDLDANDRKVSQYIDTLLKSAEDAERRDAFSKTALFDEVEFPTGQTTTLTELIESVRQVIENTCAKSILTHDLFMDYIKSYSNRRYSHEVVQPYKAHQLLEGPCR